MITLTLGHALLRDQCGTLTNYAEHCWKKKKQQKNPPSYFKFILQLIILRNGHRVSVSSGVHICQLPECPEQSLWISRLPIVSPEVNNIVVYFWANRTAL